MTKDSNWFNDNIELLDTDPNKFTRELIASTAVFDLDYDSLNEEIKNVYSKDWLFKAVWRYPDGKTLPFTRETLSRVRIYVWEW